jgi:tRNA G10  N-methylase Trm11
LSLDQFTSPQLRDNWKDLNLRQLDVTMGQKWMQKELRKRFGTDGGFTNLDIRGTTSNGHHPHVQADFANTPFRNAIFNVILFDPPFLVDRRSISGHDYRLKSFRHYSGKDEKYRPGYAGWKGAYGGGPRKYGAFLSRTDLRKQLYATFTELRRILAPEGRIIFKWTNSDQTLKWALSLKNGLEVDHIWNRRSKGGDIKTTYYVWLKKPAVRGGE